MPEVEVRKSEPKNTVVVDPQKADPYHFAKAVISGTPIPPEARTNTRDPKHLLSRQLLEAMNPRRFNTSDNLPPSFATPRDPKRLGHKTLLAGMLGIERLPQRSLVSRAGRRAAISSYLRRKSNRISPTKLLQLSLKTR